MEQTTQPDLKRKMVKVRSVTGQEKQGQHQEQKTDDTSTRQDYQINVEVFLVDSPGASTFNQREFGTQHVRPSA